MFGDIHNVTQCHMLAFDKHPFHCNMANACISNSVSLSNASFSIVFINYFGSADDTSLSEKDRGVT